MTDTDSDYEPIGSSSTPAAATKSGTAPDTDLSTPQIMKYQSGMYRCLHCRSWSSNNRTSLARHFRACLYKLWYRCDNPQCNKVFPLRHHAKRHAETNACVAKYLRENGHTAETAPEGVVFEIGKPALWQIDVINKSNKQAKMFRTQYPDSFMHMPDDCQSPARVNLVAKVIDKSFGHVDKTVSSTSSSVSSAHSGLMESPGGRHSQRQRTKKSSYSPEQGAAQSPLAYVPSEKSAATSSNVKTHDNNTSGLKSLGKMAMSAQEALQNIGKRKQFATVSSAACSDTTPLKRRRISTVDEEPTRLDTIQPKKSKIGGRGKIKKNLSEMTSVKEVAAADGQSKVVSPTVINSDTQNVEDRTVLAKPAGYNQLDAESRLAVKTRNIETKPLNNLDKMTKSAKEALQNIGKRNHSTTASSAACSDTTPIKRRRISTVDQEQPTILDALKAKNSKIGGRRKKKKIHSKMTSVEGQENEVETSMTENSPVVLADIENVSTSSSQSIDHVKHEHNEGPVDVTDENELAIKLENITEMDYDLILISPESIPLKFDSDSDQSETSREIAITEPDTSSHRKGVPAAASCHATFATTSDDDLCKWSQEQVKKWVLDSNLGALSEKLNEFDGEALCEYRQMLINNPQLFFEFVDKTHGIKNVPAVLKLARHLRKI